MSDGLREEAAMNDKRAIREALYLRAGLPLAQREVVRTLCQAMYLGTSTEMKLRHARRFLARARQHAAQDPPRIAEAMTAELMADELIEMARFAKVGIGRG